MWGQKRWRCDIVQADGGGMEFHVTDVDSQTTYVSDLSPSDVWRRVSSATKVKPPPPGLKMFGLDRKAVREGVATTFKKLVKEAQSKPKPAQTSSSSTAAAAAAAPGGTGAAKRPLPEGQSLLKFTSKSKTEGAATTPPPPPLKKSKGSPDGH